MTTQSTKEDDVLIRVENVSKKFCRDFKKSLWYGVADTAADIFRINKGRAGTPTPPPATDPPDLSPATCNLSQPPTAALRVGEFWANQNISFTVRRGERLGLIGHNGAGKTTLLKMLNGLIKPDTGHIEMHGRVGALIALGAGFNPILTGRENIYVNGSILGLHKKEIDAKLEEIVDFAEVKDAIDAPVRTYSSGMQVRLGFAIASSLSPDILLVDEVLAVGDIAFQRKCARKLAAFTDQGGSFILVSHSANLISQSSDKALWLHQGLAHMSGPTQKVLTHYLDSQLNPTSSQQVINELTGHEPIRFLKAHVHSLGKEKAYPDTDVHIEVHYESEEDFDDIQWGCNFLSEDGTVRLGTIKTDSDKVGPSIRRGQGTLSCIVSHLPLAPANYQLRGGIGIRGEPALAHFGWFDERPLMIRIHPSDDSRSLNAMTWNEHLVLRAKDFQINPT